MRLLNLSLVLMLVAFTFIGSSCIQVGVDLESVCTKEQVSFPGTGILGLEGVVSTNFERDYSDMIPDYSEDDLNNSSEYLSGSVDLSVNSFVVKVLDGITDLNQFQKLTIQIKGAEASNSNLAQITLIDYVNPDYGSQDPSDVKKQIAFKILPDAETVLKYFQSGTLRFDVFASGKPPKDDWSVEIKVCFGLEGEAQISI